MHLCNNHIEETMSATTEFDDIRPYRAEELPAVFEELIADADFRKAACAALPGVPFEVLADRIRQCKTNEEFQRKLCYGIVDDIVEKHTHGVSLDHSSLKDKSMAYTYISNHRDIILDSGFLSVLLSEQGMDTVEIAIGDNLLVYPWIKKLVRINKSFIVQRSLGVRQMLESSARLSRYIHYTIEQKRQSIWIAQREGRAKDSDDRTQDSLLKMLAMGGEGDVIDRLGALHIAPFAISYEYDPCDYLKAQEFQQKRDIEGFKKSAADDVKNMLTGLMGDKGRVHLRTGICLTDLLGQVDRKLPKQELFASVSALIDKEIHRNYRLYPNNYVAADLLAGENRFAGNYTPEDKARFEAYLAGQLAKIDLPGKDEPFLREKLLSMYANPLKNHLKALG